MNLKEKSISGVKWSSASMLLVTVFKFGTLAALSRILSPAEFGLMGMVMVVVGFFQTFSDMGLSNAIIHEINVKQNDLSSLFWTNIFFGILLFILFTFIRPLAVTYFRQNALYDYLFYASFIFLISPPKQIITTLLRKNLMFSTLSKLDVASEIIYAVSAIGLALSGFGVASLIFGMLIQNMLMVICQFILIRKIWRPGLYLNLTEIKDYLSFGAFQLGERISNYLNANIDYIIIGRFLGVEALGYYTLAYNLMMVPLNRINPIIMRVAVPIFSIIQDDAAKLRRGYIKAVRYITTLTFPMLAGMLVVAPEFVRVVYGNRWEPSIMLLQAFCLAGAIKSTTNPAGSVLIAKGRADIGFYWNVFVLIVISAAVLAGVHWGILGVAISIVIVMVPLFFIIHQIICRIVGLKISSLLNSMKTPFYGSLFMMLIIMMVKLVLNDINMIMLLTFNIIIGAAVYSFFYFMKDKEMYVELKSVLLGKIAS